MKPLTTANALGPRQGTRQSMDRWWHAGTWGGRFRQFTPCLRHILEGLPSHSGRHYSHQRLKVSAEHVQVWIQNSSSCTAPTVGPTSTTCAKVAGCSFAFQPASTPWPRTHLNTQHGSVSQHPTRFTQVHHPCHPVVACAGTGHKLTRMCFGGV